MMSPERWQQVKGVLQEALELAPEQVPAFLDRACSTDHSLRRDVESLLSSGNDVRSSFLRSSPDARLTLSIGTSLGDFEIVSLLGAGGMGEVYRARDHRLEREVALKVLPRFVSFDHERLHRFDQEAKAAAALNHPNILAVFQMGTYEGAPYLVSELLEGETLRERLKHGPIPLTKAIDYGLQIAYGLSAAHEKGIVHRDLKPENLFVNSDGRIKILDFGLAKLTHHAAMQSLETEPGSVLGTVGYMSPEQVRGQAADHRSDIFAFGAILYEMLSGKRAFTGESAADVASAILKEDPPRLSKSGSRTPKALESVIKRCLEKDPNQRFQSASEVASMLLNRAETHPFVFAPFMLSRKTTLRLASMAGIFLALSALIVGLNFGGVRIRLFHPNSPAASNNVPKRSFPAGPSYPVPFLNHPLVPDTVTPGGPGFTLTVSGTGFVPRSVVTWNGIERATTFVNSSQLKAAILASDIARSGTAALTVVNPRFGGGPSNEVFFSFGASGYSPLGRNEYFVGPQPDAVAVGDFDGDGKLDVAVANPGGGTVGILLGKGDGTFQSPVYYTVGQGTSNSELAVADFNGDGELDLVVSNDRSNNVSVLLGNGDGTFRPAANYDVGKNPSSVAVADVNGDGKLDLIVSNQNCNDSNDSRGPCLPGTVSVLLGNGDGTFQFHRDFAAGLVPNGVAVGDFNGDGKLDLAVVNGVSKERTSALCILLGNGDGTFRSPVGYPLHANGNSVATADFNGDGKLDLVVVDNGGLVSVFIGKGDGTFGPRVDYPAGSFPFGSIGIGDFNGDGKLDLAVASGGSNCVTILFGNGDGTFQPRGVRFGTGLIPQGVAVGDFNGNGKLDMAVPARYGNVISILVQ